ncbi:hypothetical protein TNCV_1819841 [Trichonephila clavipes]|nr:hypothetical protein TNCV_1819841 [Trichonephila clavipes]
MKFNLLAVVLRKVDWKMSQQRDLPEFMDWCIIGRLESIQAQRTVDGAVGERQEVILKTAGPIPRDSYTRAFRDGFRNFEPWLTRMILELASLTTTIPTRGRLSSLQI